MCESKAWTVEPKKDPPVSVTYNAGWRQHEVFFRVEEKNFFMFAVPERALSSKKEFARWLRWNAPIWVENTEKWDSE